MLLHWRLCLHMVLGFQALTQSLVRQNAIGQTRSLIVIVDSWWHYYPTGLYVFFFSFHLALTASPSSVLLSSLSTVIYFLSLLKMCVVCCLCISKCQGTCGHSPLNWVFPHT